MPQHLSVRPWGVDGNNLLDELSRGDCARGLMMAFQCKAVELFSIEAIFSRYHFSPGKLAEGGTGVAGFDARALIVAHSLGGRETYRRTHRNAAHALHATRDNDVHRTRCDGVGSKVQRLLR